MPLYEFKDTTTGEVFELNMSISSRDEYIASNPHIQPHYSTPIACGNPVALGIRKIDHGFNEVLSRVKAGSGRSNTIKTRQ